MLFVVGQVLGGHFTVLFVVILVVGVHSRIRNHVCMCLRDCWLKIAGWAAFTKPTTHCVRLIVQIVDTKVVFQHGLRFVFCRAAYRVLTNTIRAYSWIALSIRELLQAINGRWLYLSSGQIAAGRSSGGLRALARILTVCKWVAPAVCGCLRYWHFWRGLNWAHCINQLIWLANRHLLRECLLLHLVDWLGLEKKFGRYMLMVSLFMVMVAAAGRNIGRCCLRLHSTPAGHTLS